VVQLTLTTMNDASTETISDHDLLDQWSAGDRGAGETLFARHYDAIYRFFVNKSNDPDELVQASFINCIRAKDGFRRQSSFRTFLFAIARNTLLHHLRSLRRTQLFDPEHSSIAAVMTTPTTRIARKEDQTRLRAALRALPVEQQTLLELHYWEDLDASALGEVFAQPPGTMRVRLHRAREALRAVLAVAVVAVAATACVAAPEPETGTESTELVSCKPWGCGDNSPVLDNHGFHELHRSGKARPNPDGLYINVFRQGAAKYQIDLAGTQLVGKNAAGVVTLQGPALTGAIIEVRSVNDPSFWYDLEIKEVTAGGAAYWQGPATALETYRIEYGGHGMGRETPLCDNPVTSTVGQQGLMLNMYDVVMFSGDRYDARSKTIVASGPGASGWINFGCAGGSIAKLLLNRHNPVAHVAGFVTTIERRQAMLKMFAADYCGTGESFTHAGEPLAWRDAAGWLPDFPLVTTTHEAWWTASGVACIEVPRLDTTTEPYVGDLEADVARACGGEMPPLCSSLPEWPAQFGGALFISANPAGS
jgi:RNA polymerase sigma factor (sigma-70 family)